MKFAIVILCIALQGVLGAVEVAPKRNIATDLGQIQDYANTLHNEIESYITVYRQTLSEINAENGVSVSLEMLKAQIDTVYDRDVQARVDIWLEASEECADDLTSQLDEAFAVAGDEFSTCSVLYFADIEEASFTVLAKLDELQADSTYLQFATVLGINVHNVFAYPDYAVDDLQLKVERFREIWEDDVSVEFTSKLANYRERFLVINASWNECLQSAYNTYAAEADRIVAEASACP